MQIHEKKCIYHKFLVDMLTGWRDTTEKQREYFQQISAKEFFLSQVLATSTLASTANI